MLERLHGGFVHPRRSRILAAHIAGLLPRDAEVVDVGCGDGQLAAAIGQVRPDLHVHGIEVVVRANTAISVAPFDGRNLPFRDQSVDAVIFVDVLHHAEEPRRLLAEAKRVAKEVVVVKDHLRQGLFAGPTLAFMDRVGNLRHGVALPYTYWTPQQWHDTFAQLGFASRWDTRLGLYPWPASLLFERGLHFIARLEHVDSPEGRSR